jgi:small subunit ribosomal protein S6
VRLYETTFIINPQSDDASIDRQVKAVSDLIAANGGKIVFEDRVGTRRLAYEIRGLNQGYYANFIFEAPASVLPALDRHYRLEEPYIRYLTTVFEGDVEAIRERRDSYASVIGEPSSGSSDDREDRPARGERRDAPIRTPSPALVPAPAPAPVAAPIVEEAPAAEEEEVAEEADGPDDDEL